MNDFDLSSAYERLIEEVLDAGVRIDAIGLQTHMHKGYRGEDADAGHGRPVRPVRAPAADDGDRPSSPGT